MDPHAPDDRLLRHAALIRRVARVYGRDAADADEIAQEIAVQLWRSAGRFDGRCRESTWVYRIALNVAISYQRRERRHRAGHVALEDPDRLGARAETPGPSPDVARLLEVIADLDPLDKALALLHLEGNAHDAIAEILGISVSNAGTRLHRLRAKVRAEWERREARERRNEGR